MTFEQWYSKTWEEMDMYQFNEFDCMLAIAKAAWDIKQLEINALNEELNDLHKAYNILEEEFNRKLENK